MKTEDSINQRLKFLVYHYTVGNAKDFADSLGLVYSSFVPYLSNRLPNYETLRKVLSTYPEVSAHWLLTGEGEPFDASANGSHDYKEMYAEAKQENGFLKNELSKVTSALGALLARQGEKA